MTDTPENSAPDNDPPPRQRRSDYDTASIAQLLRHLSDQGVLDRAHMLRVGCVEVYLSPADVPDPEEEQLTPEQRDVKRRERLMLRLLGPGRDVGRVG